MNSIIYMCSYIQLVQNLTSRDYADGLRAKIWDNSTHGTMYYGPTFYDRLTTSTAHLSVLGNDNIAVSVTTTVNLRYVSPLIRQKKMCVYSLPTDPNFWPGPKLFYGTFSRKLFKYPIFAFQCSFWWLRNHYFDKNKLKLMSLFKCTNAF